MFTVPALLGSDGRFSEGSAQCLQRIAGRAGHVVGHMGHSCGVAGGAGSAAAGRIFACARRAMRLDRSTVRDTRPNIAARPGARCFDGAARTIVARAHALEENEHPFGAISRPRRRKAAHFERSTTQALIEFRHS